MIEYFPPQEPRPKNHFNYPEIDEFQPLRFLEYINYSKNKEDFILDKFEEQKTEEMLKQVGFCISISRNKANRKKHFLYTVNNSLKLGASITPFDNYNKITINFGTLWSLEDLFLNLTCNEEFFSYSKSGEKLWHGAEIINYTPKYDGMNDMSVLGSNFNLMTTDRDRLILVGLLMNIAITYLIIHEETHYDAGHIDFMGSAAKHFNGIDEVNTRVPNSSRDLMTAMEWEADYFATRGVWEVFNHEYFYPKLPGYCEGNEEAWMARAVVSAIGALNIMQERYRIMLSMQSLHPSPKCRLISALYNLVGRAREQSSKSAAKIIMSSHLALFDTSRITNELNGSEIFTNPKKLLGPSAEEKLKGRIIPIEFLENRNSLLNLWKYFRQKTSGESATASGLPKEEQDKLQFIWYDELEDLVKKQKTLRENLRKFWEPIGIIK